MIIKSMSRKEPSFAQLIDYMTDVQKSEEKYFVYHNVYSRTPQALTDEFMQNSRLVQRRKNGVYLYHEILSIKAAEKLAQDEQKALLRDIARDYAVQRAEPCMVFGALHDDHGDDHLHYHLVISANHVGQSKKHRMSRAEFDQFKKGLEAKVLQDYPQLEQKITISKQAAEKLSNKGAERKRRTGKTPERDLLKAKLQTIFEQSNDRVAFFSALSEAGLEFYLRGNTPGVKDLAAGRNHRFKTLGILDGFTALSGRIGLDGAVQQATASENTQSEKEAKETTSEAREAEKPKTNKNASDTPSSENTKANQTPQKPTNNREPKGAEAESTETQHRQARSKQDSPSDRSAVPKQQAPDAEPPLSAVEKEKQRRRDEAASWRSDQSQNKAESSESNSTADSDKKPTQGHKPKR